MAGTAISQLNTERITTFTPRPLSTWEYFQACSGTNPHTLEVAREIHIVCEGQGTFDPDALQAALNAAIAANPACKLRLTGKRQKSRWLGDGQGPSLRIIRDSNWRGIDSPPNAFVRETPFSLERGITAELLVIYSSKTYVFLRAHHAVMDGLGGLHFMQEVFRALRGEPLLGTNAIFSDGELTAAVTRGKTPAVRGACAHATGGVKGTETGNSWSRISLSGKQPKLLARASLAVAEYARRFSDKPTRLSIPVSLRRYQPDILSTMNYTSFLYMDIHDADTVDSFQQQLKALLAQSAELPSTQLIHLSRYLPLPWFDILTARTDRNYTKGRILQTMCISNLGVLDSAEFTGGGFTAERFFAIPPPGVAYIIIASMDNNTDITVGLPDTEASEGRLQEYTDFLQQRLQPVESE